MWEKMNEMKDVILSNHRTKARGSLCPRDLDALESWYPVLDITNENMLNKVGMSETTEIGKDLVKMYPKVFKNMSVPATVMYAYSSQNPAKQTAQVFLDGMRLAGSTARVINLGEFSALSVDQSCPKYKDFLTSPENLKESRMYKAQMEIKEMLKEVSHRLGYSYDLNFDVVFQMYKLCSFETGAYLGKISPWCAVFEKRHFKIFQNDEDINSYYTMGFGSTYAPRLGCPAIKNLFQILGEITKHTPDDPQVTVLFAHSNTLRFVLTALGIAWDSTILTARNVDVREDRMWNSSLMVPFSANLQVVLHKCQNYKVTFILNNYKVLYSTCNSTKCDWDVLRDEYEDIIDPLSCNFDFCSHQLNSIGHNTHVHFFVTLLVMFKIIW
ncbi:multiple inositol polyphosphate phosphatase 1-like isoform X2 [Cimex lectularius]|nr:multiple inositol polyphosphate phosphatase 1-like isoform X2 [Cimex lectularius]